MQGRFTRSEGLQKASWGVGRRWQPASLRRRLSFGRGRQAFTLVELLVVIAIIGVLVALLLPAVQAAREAARRMSCTNKLKQLGLALHNYHDTHRTFPPGVLLFGSGANCPPMGGTNETGASWLVLLLPYLEQQPLYQQFNFHQRFVGRFNLINQSPNGPWQFQPLALVKCPSDPKAIANGSVVTNYVGVAGGGCNGLTNCGNLPAPDCEGAAGRLYFSNGVFFKNSNVRLANITDGTTNVYLLGETNYMRVPSDANVGTNYPSWAAGADLRVPAINSSYQTMAAAVLPINSPALPTDSGGFMRLFGSHHVRGCNMTLADGSTRFVSDNINLQTHRLLGARDDGIALGDF
jgi:prepilin-type N-terminal cleavage/methylation domain-containing protein